MFGYFKSTFNKQVKFTLPRDLFTHLGFQSVRIVLGVTFIPGFIMIMD